MKTLFRIAALVCFALTLGGCASTREITDFKNTSIIYGWVDMKEAPSGISYGQVFNLNAKDKYAYFNLGVEKLEGGYLFYHVGMEPGNYRMVHLSGQNCLLIFCSNTIHEYSFGEDSDYRFNIGKPSVHFIGAYDYKKIKTGFFKPKKFDFVKARKPPTRRQMLERILKEVENDDSPRFAPALGRLKTEIAKAQ